MNIILLHMEEMKVEEKKKCRKINLKLNLIYYFYLLLQINFIFLTQQFKD